MKIIELAEGTQSRFTVTSAMTDLIMNNIPPLVNDRSYFVVHLKDMRGFDTFISNFEQDFPDYVNDYLRDNGKKSLDDGDREKKDGIPSYLSLLTKLVMVWWAGGSESDARDDELGKIYAPETTSLGYCMRNMIVINLNNDGLHENYAVKIVGDQFKINSNSKLLRSTIMHELQHFMQFYASGKPEFRSYAMNNAATIGYQSQQWEIDAEWQSALKTYMVDFAKNDRSNEATEFTNRVMMYLTTTRKLTPKQYSHFQKKTMAAYARFVKSDQWKKLAATAPHPQNPGIVQKIKTWLTRSNNESVNAAMAHAIIASLEARSGGKAKGIDVATFLLNKTGLQPQISQIGYHAFVDSYLKKKADLTSSLIAALDAMRDEFPD